MAIDNNGNQSATSEVSAATTATSKSNTIYWPSIAGARQYYVYAGTSTGTENNYFITTTNSYTDTALPSSGTSGSPVNGTISSGY